MFTCPLDKSLLRPVQGRFTCPKCGYRKEAAESVLVKGEPIERTRNKFAEIGVIDDPEKYEAAYWPVDSDVQCGGCGTWGAYYQLRQTRRADEPTTRFYQCTKCKRKWKSSK